MVVFSEKGISNQKIKKLLLGAQNLHIRYRREKGRDYRIMAPLSLFPPSCFPSFLFSGKALCQLQGKLEVHKPTDEARRRSVEATQ